LKNETPVEAGDHLGFPFNVFGLKEGNVRLRRTQVPAN